VAVHLVVLIKLPMLYHFFSPEYYWLSISIT